MCESCGRRKLELAGVRCQLCMFWVPGIGCEGDEDVCEGHCRYCSPVTEPGGPRAIWPAVWNTDFCGQFRRGVNPVKKQRGLE